MLSNELIFLLHACSAGITTLIALLISREALVGLVTAYGIFANLFVVKQIILFGFHTTASEAFAVGMSLCFNTLNEFYGKKIAMRSLYSSFFAAVCFALFSYIHLLYKASPIDKCHNAFFVILHTTPQIIFASLIAFAVSQTFENYIYAWLKQISRGSLFIVRNITTVLIAQLIDTVIFANLGLRTITNNLMQVILTSYCVKIAALFCVIPCIWLIKKVKKT